MRVQNSHLPQRVFPKCTNNLVPALCIKQMNINILVCSNSCENKSCFTVC
ncbi:hypothetical protein Hanom_Chr12g01069731 [Helianthus anomalus]